VDRVSLKGSAIRDDRWNSTIGLMLLVTMLTSCGGAAHPPAGQLGIPTRSPWAHCQRIYV